MRAPISWIREFVDLPATISGRELASSLIALGLEVETVDVVADVTGPVVIGQVASIEELTEFKKPIRFCQVDVGSDHGGQRGIVCGAQNFKVGDLVVVALPGAVLPGGFSIAQRETYGRTSDGMICSAREIELGEDHAGIMILPKNAAEVGSSAAALLGFGEEVLDIAVTPDRGYALSIRGIAREAAIAYDVAFRDRSVELADLPAPAAQATPRDCGSSDATACDVFTLRTILKVDAQAPTPLWMTQRLIAAGLRPVSIIVDITNYVMLESGQPLHAFDAERVTGAVVARRASAGETFETLDHVARSLDVEDLVISDDNGAIALAGTMGGVSSEIDLSATNVLLEAAHFDPLVIARMSRRHKLSSEASRRFERGVDPDLAPYASERAATLILELAGGVSAGMTAEEAGREPRSICLEVALPGQIAGMEIAPERVVACLQTVGCDVAQTGQDLVVAPPSWRPDLNDPADLVEEVIRLVGYDHIPSTLPAAPPGHGLTDEQKLRRSASRIAVALGLTEVLNYPFVGQADLDRCEIPEGDPRRSLVTLANPLSEEQPSIRTSLLPGLLGTARRNVSRGADQIAIFEVGSIAFPITRDGGQLPRPTVDRRPSDAEVAALKQLLPVQRRHLAGILAGPAERRGWWGGARIAQWSDAIEVAVTLVQELGLEVVVDSAGYAPFHPGRCAVVSLVNQDADGELVIVGYAGELHPRVCANWDLAPRTCAFEIDLQRVIEFAVGKVAQGPRFSSMPVAKEDVALVVASSTPAADVAEALTDGGGPLLESVRLFDVYEGPQVEAGSKSLAFSLRFRAPDRTLGVDELSAARDAAVAAAADRCAATLRA